MKQDIELILLPTEKFFFKGIIKSEIGTLKINRSKEFPVEYKHLWQPHHLYGVTNKIPKVDDIIIGYYEDAAPIITKVYSIDDEGVQTYRDGAFDFNHCKKVIVSSDRNLHGRYREDTKSQVYSENYKLPTFKQEFLEEFCRFGGTDSVTVEYKVVYSEFTIEKCWFELNINSDNTINTFPIEPKLYTGPEVERLISSCITEIYKGDTKPTLINNWIRKNLYKI